jgi:hypothetical protein
MVKPPLHSAEIARPAKAKNSSTRAPLTAPRCRPFWPSGFPTSTSMSGSGGRRAQFGSIFGTFAPWCGISGFAPDFEIVPDGVVLPTSWDSLHDPMRERKAARPIGLP